MFYVSLYISTMLSTMVLNCLALGWYSHLTLFFFFKIFLAIVGNTFIFLYKFKYFLVDFCKIHVDGFWVEWVWMYRSSWKKMGILTTLSLLNYEHLFRSFNFSQQYFVIFYVEVFYIFYRDHKDFMMLLYILLFLTFTF